jgi:hypothetical protein
MTALSALLPTCLAKVNACFGSFADLQRPQEYCRLSARNETFGAERRQSAGKPTFRRG